MVALFGGEWCSNRTVGRYGGRLIGEEKGEREGLGVGFWRVWQSGQWYGGVCGGTAAHVWHACTRGTYGSYGEDSRSFGALVSMGGMRARRMPWML